MTGRCPACGRDRLETFHRVDAVPVRSCLLLPTAAEARAHPTGTLRLDWCAACGFITNGAFVDGLVDYSDYEETQAHSPTFRAFARALAERWVADHGLRDATVVEIGCGKGEFLELLADAGIGRGIGVDPAIRPGHTPTHPRLEWIAESYLPERHGRPGGLVADAVVCRHTLEHLPDVAGFLRDVRRGLGDDGVLLLEVPDTQRVLDEVAFWDTYYEHCSYWTTGSLARAVAAAGFEVLSVELAYDEQYVLLAARPGDTSDPGRFDDREAIAAGVERFRRGFREQVATWDARLRSLAVEGGRAVIWGAGSKGVAFLGALARPEDVVAAVDINPAKWEHCLAGPGHRVVAAADLKLIEPQLVIVMNPIYVPEISENLASLGIDAEVVAV